MSRVVFIHPDLGIGGAERLVVDAALALKAKGHDVHMYTSHHDSGHCFEETRDGTIPVSVYGDWLPLTIFGYGHAVCAYARMLYLALAMVILDSFNVVVCDQVSACIPIFRLFTSAKVLFYCHFPDQLLAPRKSKLKALYRAPIDWLEEKTTGMADTILVNSNFTRGIFAQTFRTLTVVPGVLYPSLNFDAFDKEPTNSTVPQFSEKFVFLSINRFERKKDIALAIKAAAALRTQMGAEAFAAVRLVMAGGYDPRVAENVEYFEELNTLAEQEGLAPHITFIRSFSDADKTVLLRRCSALLYTPANEHFGITPLEAMYVSRPVIAVSSGGPLETVCASGSAQTGFLCPPQPAAFASAMLTLINKPSLIDSFGVAGRDRVKKNFSFAAFAAALDTHVRALHPSSQ